MTKVWISKGLAVALACLTMASCKQAPPPNEDATGQGKAGTDAGESSASDVSESADTMDSEVGSASRGIGEPKDVQQHDADSKCPGAHESLAPGKKSSLQPCLCFPDGTNCDALGKGHGVKPDVSSKCPANEFCTGGVEVVFSSGKGKGKCERLCEHPEATVKGSGGCGEGSHCALHIIGAWTTEPSPLEVVGVCRPGPPVCPKGLQGKKGEK